MLNFENIGNSTTKPLFITKLFWENIQILLFRRMTANTPFMNNGGGSPASGSPLPPPPSSRGNGVTSQNGQFQINISTSPPPSMKNMRKKGLPWILAALTATIVILLFILSYFLFKLYYQDTEEAINFTKLNESQKSDWPSIKPNTNLARFTRAAVVSDNGLCSEIGRSVLLKGGNAIDSAISTTICVGALNSHSSGLGGGFILTYYSRFYGKCFTLDARETAPLGTDQNTFNKNPKDAFFGYKSIAVPGELHGLWAAFKRFSSLRISWQDLIMPTVQLLNNGYPITKLMEMNLRIIEDKVMAEPTMRRFFINNSTNELYKEGEILKNPQLAETLRKLAISPEPVRLFYNGEMAKQIADEIGENEGFITKKDLESYRSIWNDQPLTNDHFEKNQPLVICGPKPSSSFAITQLIIAIMSRFYPIGSNSSIPYTSAEYYHRFIEAQKFAYAQRTFLGDSKFVKNFAAENLTKKEFIDEIVKKISNSPLSPKEYGGDITRAVDDQGTSQISIIDSDGNAVSLTSSINNIFGAVVRSERLGIVWNDQMDDFSLPGQKNFFGFEASPNNYIEPGKRPLSSMSPLIIYNNNTKQVTASIGGSGGSKIISALAQVILQTLNFNNTVKEAIEMPRIHNQFTPFETTYEKDFSQKILDSLNKIGHANITEMRAPFASIQAIFRSDSDESSLYANNDYRRKVYNYPTGY